MFRCNRNLLPVAVLEEGKSNVDECWHFTWGKHLCLCSTGMEKSVGMQKFSERSRLQKLLSLLFNSKITTQLQKSESVWSTANGWYAHRLTEGAGCPEMPA